jgi:SAM-dependent methyltransferase
MRPSTPHNSHAHQHIRADPPHPRDRASEVHLLRRHWIQAPSADRPCAYFSAQFSSEIALERRLRVVDMIAPAIHGRVLEWGCRYGFDSYVYRLRFGQRVELHGCDVCDPGEFAAYHGLSGLHYRQVEHPVRLDYEAGTFDVVTSDGVLEHVPDPEGSVAEIHRVLRPGGTFVVACLPNRWSYTEAFQRWRGVPAHDRLFTLGSARNLLRSHGFEVVSGRRYFMVPTMLNGFGHPIRQAYQHSARVVWAVNDALERAWPVNRLASNLMLTAVKAG